MKELKNAMAKAIEAAEACDAADRAWCENVESRELEAAFDAAYRAQHEAEARLYAAIEAFTGGAIDRKTARLMWVKKREQLRSLIARAA